MNTRWMALALTLSATSGCSHDKGVRPSDGGDAAAPSAASRRSAPLASGAVTVKGGETLALDGTSVAIDQVDYLDQPCPPDARCIHSGVIKQVRFRVTRAGATRSATVTEHGSLVLDGVELKVNAVRPGPEAEVEASLPLTRSP